MTFNYHWNAAEVYRVIQTQALCWRCIPTWLMLGTLVVFLRLVGLPDTVSSSFTATSCDEHIPKFMVVIAFSSHTTILEKRLPNSQTPSVLFRCNLPPAFFLQNVLGLLSATVVTGVKWTPNMSQHRKLTLENKILPPSLLGFKLATFDSNSQSFNHEFSTLPTELSWPPWMLKFTHSCRITYTL